jgi:cysteinyl-tRNA synthetase
LAELWGLLKDGPAEPEALAAVFDMDRVLGLDLQSVCAGKQDEDGAKTLEIEDLIGLRAESKKAKDFATADGIRQKLKEQGIILEDGPAGTTWRRV